VVDGVLPIERAAAVEHGPVGLLRQRFADLRFIEQSTKDEIPTVWVPSDGIQRVLAYLKSEIDHPYRLLYDLTAIDERTRRHRDGQPDSDFTVVYHLLSYTRNQDLRLKVALRGDHPTLPSVTRLFPLADWYEREAWDMFGIVFDGHPRLNRILMPPTWVGHPLRKDHPARGTELGMFSLPVSKEIAEEEALQFRPEDWGMERQSDTADFMFLNLGPNHPSVHGVFRLVLQLDGEEIIDIVPDIGYHHRTHEKISGSRHRTHPIRGIVKHPYPCSAAR
jgi:NADH-quinone oxidoreductase subunit C/D